MTPKVFISYSHDSPAHSECVLNLAWVLRDHGIDVELDQFHKEEIVDWPRWCSEQLSREHSDFVVCVCTAEYKRRIEGQVPPEKGKGVYWEGSLLDDHIYDEKGNRRIIPILLGSEPKTSIVQFLRGWTHCRIHDYQLSDPGYEHLLRLLTGQVKIEKNALGSIPVLPQQRAPGPSRSAVTSVQVDLSHFDVLKYAPRELIGREAEMELLSDTWADVQAEKKPRSHLLTFVALGGEGKTSLVSKWAAGLAAQDWPGCDAVFAWSFYSQGTREQVAASSDLFLKEALSFFGDEAMAQSAEHARDKGKRLAQLIGARRALLILDGVEPLQYAPTSPTPGELKDQGLAALLKGLATSSRGLCVISTRYALPELRAFLGGTVREEPLKSLSREAGVHLLKAHGVVGSDRKNVPLKAGDEHSEKVSEFEKLVEDVEGHALTLHIMGSFLKRAFKGDIRCRDRVSFEKASRKTDNDHAFRAMAAYAQWMEDDTEESQRELAILRLMGLFDRPATADCLGALLQAPAIPGLTEPLIGLAVEDWNCSLDSLENANLITRSAEASNLPHSALHLPHSLDAHPLLREYFARRVREGQPEAWREAHRRLYEHLCASTHEGVAPTLEDLQPLYQAVAHGCQAGLQQEACDKVYIARIQRRNEAYSTAKLGAFGSDLGAVACFFELPWSRVSPALTESHHAWLLNEAAFCLRALGRLSEALEPMRAGLPIELKREDWKSAAIIANNLSELELTLGEVTAAERDAEQSVTYADRSGDAFERMSMRTTHADALHQAGMSFRNGVWKDRRAEAEARFREAEQMQQERQPEYPLLYSLWGFRYCDLLLSAPERAAWRSFGVPPLGGQAEPSSTEQPSTEPPEGGTPSPELLSACRAVTQRAAQTLKLYEQGSWASLLTIALDHLTLGRAALYSALLSPRSSRREEPHEQSPGSNTHDTPEHQSPFTSAATELAAAVTGLRRAGQQDDLPRGLLSRAWCFAAEASSLASTAAQSVEVGKAVKDETQPRLQDRASEAARLLARAQEDLDEAWEIAERGPMPLHMADILLYRARLFFRAAEYPWKNAPDREGNRTGNRSAKDDLADAEYWINHCGYHRRDEELADAKQAMA